MRPGGDRADAGGRPAGLAVPDGPRTVRPRRPRAGARAGRARPRRARRRPAAGLARGPRRRVGRRRRTTRGASSPPPRPRRTGPRPPASWTRRTRSRSWWRDCTWPPSRHPERSEGSRLDPSGRRRCLQRTDAMAPRSFASLRVTDHRTRHFPVPHVLFVFLDGVGLGPATDAIRSRRSTCPLSSGWRAASGGRPRPRRSASRGTSSCRSTRRSGWRGCRRAGPGRPPSSRARTPPPSTAATSARTRRRRCGRWSPSGACSPGSRQPASPTARLAFANAYPDRFFRSSRRRGRWTVTTLAAHSAGVRLRRAGRPPAGRALTADLTAEGWRAVRPRPRRPDGGRGGRPAGGARRRPHVHPLRVLPDRQGRPQPDAERAADVLASLDAFLGPSLDALPDDALLVLSSDHGNLEDSRPRATRGTRSRSWPGARAPARSPRRGRCST